jgi:hypothetical protein
MIDDRVIHPAIGDWGNVAIELRIGAITRSSMNLRIANHQSSMDAIHECPSARVPEVRRWGRTEVDFRPREAGTEIAGAFSGESP